MIRALRPLKDREHSGIESLSFRAPPLPLQPLCMADEFVHRCLLRNGDDSAVAGVGGVRIHQ